MTRQHTVQNKNNNNNNDQVKDIVSVTILWENTHRKIRANRSDIEINDHKKKKKKQNIPSYLHGNLC